MFQIVAPQITIFTSLALFLKVAPTCCKNCMDAVSGRTKFSFCYPMHACAPYLVGHLAQEKKILTKFLLWGTKVTKSRLQRDTPQGQISLEGRRWSNVLHIRSWTFGETWIFQMEESMRHFLLPFFISLIVSVIRPVGTNGLNRLTRKPVIWSVRVGCWIDSKYD